MRCTRDIRFGTVTYHSPLPTVLVLGHRSRNPQLERLDPAREAGGGGHVGRRRNGDEVPRELEVPFEGAAARREPIGRGGGSAVGAARHAQRAGVREPRLHGRVRGLCYHVADARARLVGREVNAQLVVDGRRGDPSAHQDRSEEHTSELQSQSNLVCRLLLEKKNAFHDETGRLNVDCMNIISNDHSNKLNSSRKARVSYKVQRYINASLNRATSTRAVSSHPNFVTRQKIEIIFG